MKNTVLGLLAGVLGSLLVNAFTGQSANAQAQASKVIKAERIELVNKQGIPMATLSVIYSAIQPEGFPLLTFEDIFQGLKRTSRLSAMDLHFFSGERSLVLEPATGMLMKTDEGLITVGNNLFDLKPWFGIEVLTKKARTRVYDDNVASFGRNNEVLGSLR
jgi:hypothetical protein